MVHFHMPLLDKLVQRHRERKALRREQKLLRLSGGRRALEQQELQQSAEIQMSARRQRRSRHRSSARRSRLASAEAVGIKLKPAGIKNKHWTEQLAGAALDERERRSRDEELCFSFAGGGWLMVYMYGVAKALRELGLHENSQFIGTSAGCLAIVSMVGGSDFDAILETIVTSYVPQAHASLQGPFNMREYLVDAITRHTRRENLALLNDKCTVVYTSLSAWQARKVSQFRDFHHLLWTMVASCCATPLVGMPFRHEGEWVIDGGIMENQPVFASPELAKKTVTVSPNIYSGADIRPSRYVPAWWSMYPPSERDMRWLYALGYEDGLNWAVREGFEGIEAADVPTAAATYDGGWKTVIGQVVGYRAVEDAALACVGLLHLSRQTTAHQFLRVEMSVWKALAVLAAAVDRVAIIWTVLATATLAALVALDQHHTLEFFLVAASHLSVAVLKTRTAFRQVDGSEQWRTLQASVLAVAAQSSVYDAAATEQVEYERSRASTLTREQHEALVESSFVYRMSSAFV